MATQKKESLRERAYHSIKEEIITLKLRPGAFIDRDGLQRSLGLGITPMREALLQLQAENLVVLDANKGFFVKNIDFTDISDILENRLYFERYTAFLASVRITQQKADDLEDYIQKNANSITENDYTRVIFDAEVHLAIARAANNNQLYRLMESFYTECQRIWFISQYNEGPDYAITSHLELVTHLRNHDWENTEKSLFEHNKKFRENVSFYFQRLLILDKSEFLASPIVARGSDLL